MQNQLDIYCQNSGTAGTHCQNLETEGTPRFARFHNGKWKCFANLTTDQNQKNSCVSDNKIMVKCSQGHKSGKYCSRNHQIEDKIQQYKVEEGKECFEHSMSSKHLELLIQGSQIKTFSDFVICSRQNLQRVTHF